MQSKLNVERTLTSVLWHVWGISSSNEDTIGRYNLIQPPYQQYRYRCLYGAELCINYLDACVYVTL